MVQRLLLLTTAVVATLGHTEVSTCGASFSTDSTCQNDTTALLQVAAESETLQKMVMKSSDDSLGPVGSNGPKYQQLIDMKDAMITSMNDWRSSRDLARVSRVQNVTISPKCTLQIFSAVQVFGKDEIYIALLVEKNGDAYWDHPKRWMSAFDSFVIFCAGPNGSHKTQMIARGHAWVCPWPRDEWQTAHIKVFLEDQNGANLGMVVAEHDPKLLGHLVGNVFVFPGKFLRRVFRTKFLPISTFTLHTFTLHHNLESIPYRPVCFLYNWPFLSFLTYPVLLDVVGDVVNLKFSFFT